MLSKFEHLQKVLSPKFLTEFGITILSKLKQQSKAPLPIVVTESGI